jgi:hypothetical protein
MAILTDEILSAYLDGHADGAGRAAVEEAIRSDPALAERLLRLTMHDRALRAAVDDALGDIPPSLTAVLAEPRNDKNVIQFRPRARQAMGNRWAMPAAVAASMAAGLVAGVFWQGAGATPFTVATAEGVVVGSPIAQALSGAKSGETRREDGAAVQIQLSFVARDGRLCRQFTAAFKDDSGAGVACHDGRGWRMEAWTNGAGPAGDGIREASGPENPVITAELAQLGVAKPLDRAGESAALASGWAPAHGR